MWNKPYENHNEFSLIKLWYLGYLLRSSRISASQGQIAFLELDARWGNGIWAAERPTWLPCCRHWQRAPWLLRCQRTCSHSLYTWSFQLQNSIHQMQQTWGRRRTWSWGLCTSQCHYDRDLLGSEPIAEYRRGKHSSRAHYLHSSKLEEE